MERERQFLHDLHRRRVKVLPFLHLFQKNKELRKELFQQYLKTDLKPDYDLFQSSHYSQKKLEEGIVEVRKRIPLSRVGMASFVPQTDFEISLHNLKRDFADLVAKDQLPEKFKKHRIEETAIIKKLNDLQPVIYDFSLYVVRNREAEIKEYAEAFAKNLINVLRRLNNNLLSKLILEDFLAKQHFSEERIDYLVDNKIEADNAKRKYRQLTMFANNIIHEYLASSSQQFQNGILQPEPIDVNQNRTKKVIADIFERMDKKGWEYAFTSEQDYNTFTDLLTNYFEHKDYPIPETEIQLKRTCKTKVAKALGEIHAELSEKPLKSDTEYFKIVKVLNHFKEVSDFSLVKAMQR